MAMGYLGHLREGEAAYREADGLRLAFKAAVPGSAEWWDLFERHAEACRRSNFHNHWIIDVNLKIMAVCLVVTAILFVVGLCCGL